MDSEWWTSRENLPHSCGVGKHFNNQNKAEWDRVTPFLCQDFILTDSCFCCFFSISGAGLSVSDNESCHGSQDGGSMANSQIVELRRIPIADTHL